VSSRTLDAAAAVDVAPEAGHRGRLGLVQGTALYIASVLGTGILVLPGLAAEAAGPASIVAVAAVLVLSIPLAERSPRSRRGSPTPAGWRATCGGRSDRRRHA
jgi:amino acid efflux transporter